MRRVLRREAEPRRRTTRQLPLLKTSTHAREDGVPAVDRYLVVEPLDAGDLLGVVRLRFWGKKREGSAKRLGTAVLAAAAPRCGAAAEAAGRRADARGVRRGGSAERRRGARALWSVVSSRSFSAPEPLPTLAIARESPTHAALIAEEPAADAARAGEVWRSPSGHGAGRWQLRHSASRGPPEGASVARGAV